MSEISIIEEKEVFVTSRFPRPYIRGGNRIYHKRWEVIHTFGVIHRPRGQSREGVSQMTIL